MPQKPWSNQFVAHLHFVLCVCNCFAWPILGVLSGAAARVTVTWTVAGALLVRGTLARSLSGAAARVTVTWIVAGALLVGTLAKLITS